MSDTISLHSDEFDEDEQIYIEKEIMPEIVN